MKKIDAIIKPFKLDDVREALAEWYYRRDDGHQSKGFVAVKAHRAVSRRGIYGGFSAEGKVKSLC